MLYQELVFAAIKKSGKTGFAALFTLTMLLLFGGRFAEGYCVANDLEQAQSRVCAAGANPTISCLDELWGYVSENSRRLWDEMVPPPTRKVACRLTVTYAGFSGESVLLEELHKRGMAQPEVAPNLHAGDGLLMAWHHDPIAPWQTEQWLAEMRRSLRPNQYLRMIENRFVTSESSFVDMASPNAIPIFVDKNLPIFIGVDASVKHDSTAIVAVTPIDQQRVRLVTHRIFEPTPAEPLDLRPPLRQR